MSNIIFDIETVGYDFNQLQEPFKQNILKYTSSAEEEEKEKQKLGLWPLTAEIATIAMLDVDTNKGYVFFQSPGKNTQIFIEDKIKFVPATEPQILKNFWEQISKYDKFITFNGRRFDCPFILIRSAINRIKPTRNIMPHRYSTTNHIDLFDQLSFYGSVQKKFPLDLWCRAFNIQSPKEKCSGENVQKLFKEKKHTEIAQYCLSDVRATLKLFKYWNKYINV